MIKQALENLRHLAIGVFTMGFFVSFALYLGLMAGIHLWKLVKFLLPFIN